MRLDSGFHGLDSGFQGLDSGFQTSAFQIPKAKKCWIPDSGFPYMGRRDPSRFHFGHDDYYRQIKSSVLIVAVAANGFIYKDLLSSLLHPPTDQPKHCKQLPEKQTSLDIPPIDPALAAMLDFVT